MQSLSRSYPSKEIQPLLMLTAGIDLTVCRIRERLRKGSGEIQKNILDAAKHKDAVSFVNPNSLNTPHACKTQGEIYGA
jgi:hypothetical protein